jgi:hypothetical protein
MSASTLEKFFNRGHNALKRKSNCSYVNIREIKFSFLNSQIKRFILAFNTRKLKTFFVQFIFNAKKLEKSKIN